MKLNSPFVITSRLLPGLHFRDGEKLSEISITFDGTTGDGRARYRYYIDAPGLEHTANDLKSGCGGGSLQEGMESLLSFLSACVESRNYSRRTGRDGENSDLFPDHVAQWAANHSSEIEMAHFEISEAPNLITD